MQVSIVLGLRMFFYLNCNFDQANLIRRMKDSDSPVNIGGDGKYDSPGKLYFLFFMSSTCVVCKYIFHGNGTVELLKKGK